MFICKFVMYRKKRTQSFFDQFIVTLNLYWIGYIETEIRSRYHFLFLDNIEKKQENFKLSFEYF